MKKILLFVVTTLLLSTAVIGQVKDYELGADRLNGRGNFSGGYFNYS